MPQKILTRCLLAPVVVAAFVAPGILFAATEAQAIDLTIKNHQFFPAEIHVKSGQPAVLNIHNSDDGVEEFDSPDLKVEKIITGHNDAKVHLRPLAPGSYIFIGEFHADTAQGVVIAE